MLHWELGKNIVTHVLCVGRLERRSSAEYFSKYSLWGNHIPAVLHTEYPHRGSQRQRLFIPPHHVPISTKSFPCGVATSVAPCVEKKLAHRPCVACVLNQGVGESRRGKEVLLWTGQSALAS
ncbi:hypothetical protein CP532_0687 [Ophiocordyceps camponoti-leonardi (nom. inval.)]|nr:hypothetical protein CP532_0687 [Ophiocordyceps camponoti-leonardi (nom. inval.)]